MPTSTARSARSSSQSISSSAKARLRVPPGLADPVRPLEVGEHQDVEELGAGSRPEGVEALAEILFDLLPGSRDRNASTYQRPPGLRAQGFTQLGAGTWWP